MSNHDQNQQNQLGNVFAGVIAQAANAPAQTGAVEKYARRLEGVSEMTIILADTSGSMAESAGTRRKIDVLADALREIIPTEGDRRDPNLALFYFNTIQLPATWGPYGRPFVPHPDGGTALHRAIDYIERHHPRKTIVISDGQPDDAGAALDAADRLTGQIDVIYVGPDSDAAAIAFMRRLARVGGGRVVVHDIRRQPSAQAALTGTVRQMLALPAPGEGMEGGRP